MTEAIRRQLEAAGALPSGGKGKHPPAAPRAPQRQKLPQEQPPTLRPAYCVASWEGYAGLRFVCHGLTPEQAEGLRQACATLGIREQP